MILGFSHVVVGCFFSTSFNAHSGVPSSSEKWPFMQRKAKSHDLVVDMPGVVPIELVKHDTGLVPAKPKIKVAGRGYIEVYAQDKWEEMDFMSMFGAIEDDLIAVRSPITNWKVNIGVVHVPDAPLDPPLDLEGCAALAFYSSDVEADLDGMVDRGCELRSSPFAVQVGGRNLLIALGRSPDGTIIELVQVRK